MFSLVFLIKVKILYFIITYKNHKMCVEHTKERDGIDGVGKILPSRHKCIFKLIFSNAFVILLINETSSTSET